MLRCDPPVHVSLVHFHSVLATQRVDPGVDEVTFIVSPPDLDTGSATVRLRVVAARTGEPIGGAEIELSSSGSGNNSGTAGSDGVALLTNVARGRLELLVHVPRRELLRRAVVAETGTITDLGDVALDEAVEVHGRLVDDRGAGVSTDYALGVLDPATGAIELDGNRVETSGVDGAFASTGLGRRQYVLRTLNHDALHDDEREETTWVSGNQIVDARAGSVPALVVQLRPAALLLLRVADGSPDGLRFRVDDQDGRELVSGRFYGPGPRPLKLPAGPYRVVLLDAQGRVLAEESVNLGTSPLEVELAR